MYKRTLHFKDSDFDFDSGSRTHVRIIFKIWII